MTRREKTELNRVFLSLLISIGAFLLFYLVIAFPFPIAALLTFLVYLGCYLALKPILRIGNYEVERLQSGKELSELLDEGTRLLDDIKSKTKQIKDPDILEDTKKMVDTGEKVMNYLEQQPTKITKARQFLTYQLVTANTVLSDYLEVDQAQINIKEMAPFKRQTENIMVMLNETFEKQFGQLVKDKMINVELENELLEKRINAERGIVHEE